MFENLGSMKRLLFARVFGRKYPLSVTHIITTKCNYRCSYCNMWMHKENEMTKEQIFRMLDEFAEMGTRRYGISGGEPLLRDDIGEIVSYARKKGMVVTLFTNGHLLKKRIGQLKDLSVLLTSFDGPEDVHDKNRVPGSYKTTIDAIKLARKKGIPVWVGATLTTNNLDYMTDLLKTARKMDFSVLFQPIYHYEGYSAPKEHIKDMSDFGVRYRRAIHRIMKMKKAGYPVLNSNTYLRMMKYPHEDPQKPGKGCWASRMYCAITPGGRVSPCFKIYNQKKWPEGTRLGFKNAFMRIPKRIRCNGCFSYATTESNLFYSLYPEVVYNMYTKLIKHER